MRILGPMEPLVILLVLCAAVMHAVWNSILKVGTDRLMTMAVVIGTGGLLSPALMLIGPPPLPESWFYIVLSAVIHCFYFFFLIRAYEVGDLSHSYPLARGSAPLMVAAGGAWFAGELAYLVKRLAETPEPGTGETMLDNTLVIWLNELGKGSSHTLNDIPFLAIGGAPGFRMGRFLDFSRKEERENGEMKVVGRVPHNRLWLAVAKSMGHELETFGLQSLCDGGALDFG